MGRENVPRLCFPSVTNLEIGGSNGNLVGSTILDISSRS
jgi:hypothetical protein